MNILITETSGYSQQALDIYRELGTVVFGAANEKQLKEALPFADVLVVRLQYHLSAEMLRRAPNLKYIVTPTTGLNHIDQEFTLSNDIRIVSLKGERHFLEKITPTAELTWGLLLGLIRQIPNAHKQVLSYQWNRDACYGQELYGKTLGVVGFGRLGRIVARYGMAFGMKVITCDVIENIKPEKGVKVVSFKELLNSSDVVSIHVQLDANTIGFFGNAAFSEMKRGAIFINTSRGELVCEKSLLNSLQTGKLAGAALDVLQNETQDQGWLENNALVKYAQVNNNLLITPHIGGACPDSMRRTELFVAQKLLSYVRS